MIDTPPTRRDALRALGVALAAGPAALADDRTAPPPRPATRPDGVDAHVHLVDSRLPGGLEVKTRLGPFPKDDADGPRKLAEAFAAEARKGGVGHALCMPRFEVSDKDPLGVAETLALATLVEKAGGPTVHAVGLAHPERFDRDHLARVEGELKRGRVKALKAYLGYVYYEPYSAGYRPYYRLAAKYDVPVVFHCGDAYSRKAKVKYAHPLKIDEVAVDFPKTRFVLAHFGNPWLLDAAQVVYKNENVWADLSAILIGDAASFAERDEGGALDREAERVRAAVEYTEAPERFLFGSDWPLAPIPAYRDFVRKLFPEKHHAAVFGGTAKRVFGL